MEFRHASYFKAGEEVEILKDYKWITPIKSLSMFCLTNQAYLVEKSCSDSSEDETLTITQTNTGEGNSVGKRRREGESSQEPGPKKARRQSLSPNEAAEEKENDEEDVQQTRNFQEDLPLPGTPSQKGKSKKSKSKNSPKTTKSGEKEKEIVDGASNPGGYRFEDLLEVSGQITGNELPTLLHFCRDGGKLVRIPNTYLARM